MKSSMVTDSDISHLSIPDRFFLYAESYGKASLSLAEKMMSEKSENTWPNASVVLMLSAHSVEMFLKACLIKNGKDRFMKTHDIEVLYSFYEKEYSETKYSFEMPFKTDYQGMNESEISEYKKQAQPSSVLYRYPSKTANEEWSGAFGFEAQSFIPIVKKVLDDIVRIKQCIT